ncbi:hypothetical protein [Streptomyces sp. NPDC057199]|uniref:hypothetical protein n=1 Tax=Streptomyces sp. NPDC057199 TaxID=3346047 RepID=UPI00363BF33E
MIGPLWGGLGGAAVRHWAARLFTSAALFWLAGLALVWYDRHGELVRERGWIRGLVAATRPYEQLPSLVAGVLLLLLMGVVVASALAAELLTLPVLRLLEGYGWWPVPLRRRWSDRRARAREEAMAVFQERSAALRVADGSGPTLSAAGAMARATRVLRTTPADPALVMPTRLGNLLRTAELRPLRKHGVDAVSCWPHLWLVLPGDSRTEITSARSALDGTVRVWLWSALFAVWTPWAWWAALVAPAAAALAYVNCLRAAGTYTVLLEAAFDVHLPLLYAAARLPAPRTAAEAVVHGERLSRYLREGSDDPELRFTPVADAEPAAGPAGTSPTAPGGAGSP